MQGLVKKSRLYRGSSIGKANREKNIKNSLATNRFTLRSNHFKDEILDTSFLAQNQIREC